MPNSILLAFAKSGPFALVLGAMCWSLVARLDAMSAQLATLNAALLQVVSTCR